MASKQFEHLQESTAARLRALIPAGCPLIVTRPLVGGFEVRTWDQRDSCHGRYQVVASWIAGFVVAWSRTRPPSPEEAIELLRVVRAAVTAAASDSESAAERSPTGPDRSAADG